MIITIDGYSCQGKTYLGEKIAEHFNLDFFPTGRMVRFVALSYNNMREGNDDIESRLERAVEIVEHTPIEIILKNDELELKETEKTLELIAEYPFVYERIVRIIIDYVKGKDVLLDGRFTFQYLPNADRCYYFISSIDRRASLVSRAKSISFDEAVEYINFRDSFEKQYEIPDYVAVINLSEFSSTEQIIGYLINDIERRSNV